MDQYPLVLLASLLHDVGKFFQRTGRRHSPGYDQFRQEHFGRNGAHAEWSADFVERFLPAEWQAARSAVLFHHNPSDYVGKLVAVADHLSSGERDDTDVQAGAQASQLLSVFARLSLDGPPSASLHSYFPLEPLSIAERALFPQPGVLPDGERQAAYTRLWDGFLRDVARLPTGDFQASFETLYYLLQKYTWAVPSAFWVSVPDVSLYDHSRTTCAIAAALYRAGTTEADLEALLARQPAAWSARRLMLLGGDVTGVQAFLYTITAKGAARGLRGRSFYLQLVGEAIARWLLRRLDLPLASLLYVGGGRFYLLTHCLDEADLAELRRDLDRTLLRCHQGDLYLALGGVALSGDDLQLDVKGGRGFGQVWADVGRELNDQKRRKFAALPSAELHGALFAPQGAGGAEPGCSVCRREGPYAGDAEGDDRKCGLCDSLEDLGAALRDAAYLYLGRVEPALPEGPARSYRDTLRAFGLDLRLFADAAALHRQAGSLDRGTLLTLQTTDFLAGDTLAASRTGGQGLALGFYLLANVTPHKGDAIATFEDLAGAATGVRRLGVLRMDVDDLGAIFGRGLAEAATLSRVANLSFLLRLYFEGWLAELARSHNSDERRTTNDQRRRMTDDGRPTTDDRELAGRARLSGGPGPEADHVYVIYSGGDDLFVVGSWDHMPGLAREIRDDFRRFVGGNPALHLSGGIALAEEHFPLYQAADHAGEALERAKGRHEKGRVVKDALDFLGQTASWPDLAAAEGRVQELRQLVEQGGAPRALIHTLGRIYQLYLDAQGRPARGKGRPRPVQVPYGRWMWVSAYALARLAERLRPPVGERIKGLQRELLEPGTIRTLGLAARWAELLLRKEES